jgi:hypothetical protein
MDWDCGRVSFRSVVRAVGEGFGTLVKVRRAVLWLCLCVLNVFESCVLSCIEVGQSCAACVRISS